MGKAKYVMIRGVLLWSISFTLLFTAIEWFTQQTMLSSWLTARLLVFGVIGFFVANFQWDGRERAYLAWRNQNRSKAKSKTPNNPKHK